MPAIPPARNRVMGAEVGFEIVTVCVADGFSVTSAGSILNPGAPPAVIAIAIASGRPKPAGRPALPGSEGGRLRPPGSGAGAATAPAPGGAGLATVMPRSSSNGSIMRRDQYHTPSSRRQMLGAGRLTLPGIIGLADGILTVTTTSARVKSAEYVMLVNS